MAIPTDAQAFSQVMDPWELLEWERDISQGSTDSDILMPGETFSSFDLVLSPEAAALGVSIRQDGKYTPTLTGLGLKYWLEVAEGSRGLAIFDAGVDVAVAFRGTTNNDPPRRRKRTTVTKVRNR